MERLWKRKAPSRGSSVDYEYCIFYSNSSDLFLIKENEAVLTPDLCGVHLPVQHEVGLLKDSPDLVGVEVEGREPEHLAECSEGDDDDKQYDDKLKQLPHLQRTDLLSLLMHEQGP